MRQVAIVGTAHGSRAAAPLMNKAWEIWGLGWDPLPRCDLRFEMHSDAELEEMTGVTDGDYKALVRRFKKPCYMQRVHDDLPNSMEYPLADVIKSVGVDYFCSTFAYMIALAIHQKVDKIGIWGVSLNTTSEYAYQRPNAEFLLGTAHGQGIRVHIAPGSALCSAPGRYGWAQQAYVDHIKATHEAQEAEALARVAKRGRLAEAEVWNGGGI